MRYIPTEETLEELVELHFQRPDLTLGRSLDKSKKNKARKDICGPNRPFQRVIDTRYMAQDSLAITPTDERILDYQRQILAHLQLSEVGIY